AEPKLDKVSRLDAKDYWVMNWREGFIFGGRNEADFSRSLVLYGLALAYHRVMSKTVNQLAQAADSGGDALLGLKVEAARFRSLYHFDNPVRASNVELSEVYEHLAQSLRMAALKREFDGKLEAVTQLINLKQSRSRLGGEGGLSDLFRREPVSDDRDSIGASRGGASRALPDAITPRKKRGWLWLVLIALVVTTAVLLPDEYRSQLQQLWDSSTATHEASSPAAPNQ
ncbi:MAG TPA: hypothetical protein VIS52_07970, partial [Motiliproteus sp.]